MQSQTISLDFNSLDPIAGLLEDGARFRELEIFFNNYLRKTRLYKIEWLPYRQTYGVLDLECKQPAERPLFKHESYTACIKFCLEQAPRNV